jgi:hypothetical protein
MVETGLEVQDPEGTLSLEVDDSLPHLSYAHRSVRDSGLLHNVAILVGQTLKGGRDGLKRFFVRATTQGGTITVPSLATVGKPPLTKCK